MRPRGSYSQITQQTFVVDRVPRGEDPVWDIQLEEGRRFIGVASHRVADVSSRSTVDHILTLWVEAVLS